MGKILSTYYNYNKCLKIFHLNTFQIVLVSIILCVCVNYANCEPKHFQPAKGKTLEGTLLEAKKRHRDMVTDLQEELPSLVKQLREQKTLGKRQIIVESLGKSEDARAISPLCDVLQNEEENAQLRMASAESLNDLYRPGLATGKELLMEYRKKIVDALLDTYSRERGPLKCVLGSQLYSAGKKEVVKAGLLKCLKDGDWQRLNAFIYLKKVDGVMIKVALPGEDLSPQVDPDASEILKESSGPGYPEQVRVRAIEMLLEIGDKASAFANARDIVENGENDECRYRALHMMPRIGTAEAKIFLEDMRYNKKFKDSAARILKWVWNK
ncbi:MAG: hypothetical protein GX410_01460 [Elusimicrobia bacterium]|nr:hypothetical protein [Elusimicrobiota bacterium]